MSELVSPFELASQFFISYQLCTIIGGKQLQLDMHYFCTGISHSLFILLQTSKHNIGISYYTTSEYYFNEMAFYHGNSIQLLTPILFFVIIQTKCNAITKPNSNNVSPQSPTPAILNKTTTQSIVDVFPSTNTQLEHPHGLFPSTNNEQMQSMHHQSLRHTQSKTETINCKVILEKSKTNSRHDRSMVMT